MLCLIQAPLAVLAQGLPAPTPSLPTSVDLPAITLRDGLGPGGGRLIGQGSTVIPTDTVPLPGTEERTSAMENLQLRILQKLPAKFYFNASCETSLRLETNPFQTPMKRKVIQTLTGNQAHLFGQFPAASRQQIWNTLSIVNDCQQVFRVLPNVTGGWAFTPRTRGFCNYFMIRDQLFNSPQLNTVVHSLGGGVQHDIPIGRKGNLMVDLQARELWQLHQIPVFDYLPGVTFTYLAKPSTVLFANALLQLRGKAPFQAPTREIDPFYTFGFLYRKKSWTFTNSATFVQNFREPFRGNAIIPINNYSWILDCEVAKRITEKIPGLQVFVRAEPIYNFHSRRTFGLSGMDFRLFYGLRLVLGKAPLTAALQQIREQLKEQEEALPPPAGGSTSGPSSALPRKRRAAPNAPSGATPPAPVETSSAPSDAAPTPAEPSTPAATSETEPAVKEVSSSDVTLSDSAPKLLTNADDMK